MFLYAYNSTLWREISNNFEVFICFMLGTEGPGNTPNTVDGFFYLKKFQYLCFNSDASQKLWPEPSEYLLKIVLFTLQYNICVQTYQFDSKRLHQIFQLTIQTFDLQSNFYQSFFFSSSLLSSSADPVPTASSLSSRFQARRITIRRVASKMIVTHSN